MLKTHPDNFFFENCLLCGQNSKLTAPSLTQSLLGTRDTREIFKLSELRFLLLRLAPLIQTLFRQARVELQLEVKKKKQWSLQNQKEPVVQVPHANLPPQILFATITPAFADIISHAAKVCNMPSHQHRWLNGSITGAISYLSDQQLWANGVTRTSKQRSYFFRQQWSHNKENWAKSEEKARYYNRSRWPSLVIIPDIVNNDMILSEIQKTGLPILGLVNSNCSSEIEYPLFAQDQSFASVHFFCHFLATLIAKEMTFWQHKAHIKKKSGSQKHLSKPFVSRRESFSQETEVMNSFFFNVFLPLQKRTRAQPLRKSFLGKHPRKNKEVVAKLTANEAEIDFQFEPFFAIWAKKEARKKKVGGKKLSTWKWEGRELKREKKSQDQNKKRSNQTGS